MTRLDLENIARSQSNTWLSGGTWSNDDMRVLIMSALAWSIRTEAVHQGARSLTQTRRAEARDIKQLSLQQRTCRRRALQATYRHDPVVRLDT